MDCRNSCNNSRGNATHYEKRDMFKQLFQLQYKAFVRAPQLATNIVVLIIIGINVLSLAFLFLGLGTGVYFGLAEISTEPFLEINKYMVYYFAFDLGIRYFFQRFNPMNIKPLLMTGLTKSKIVNHLLTRSVVSVFSFIHLLFFVPLLVVLLLHEPNPFSIFVWVMSMMLFVLINNFINLFLNQNSKVFYTVATCIALIAVLEYNGSINFTAYTQLFYTAFYRYPLLILLPVSILLGLLQLAKIQYKNNLYLDKGLEVASGNAKEMKLTWLDQFGLMGTFLKLDVKMLLRNKRSKTTLLMSFLFVFYGLLFFNNSTFSGSTMQMFAALFVSGGFVFSYGNYIPSWDSSYYPLMMTQNITYNNYLKAKWWLMVLGTIICTILASFYLVYGWSIYIMIVAAAIFNIGFNTQLVMLSGAYIKTPIDLSTNKNVMGDKSAFNMKSLLLSIPKIFIPALLFGLGDFFHGPYLGSALVALVGILSFAFRNAIFRTIEKVYKQEKYSTLHAYKQK